MDYNNVENKNYFGVRHYNVKIVKEIHFQCYIICYFYMVIINWINTISLYCRH